MRSGSEGQRDSHVVGALPSGVRIEGGHQRVKVPVAVDEGVLVDLPDLPVDVPGFQVGLEVGGIG